MPSIRALALLAVALCGAPSRVSAHEGHVHRVMGTVTSVDAARIEVDTKDGKKESFALAKDTRVLRGKVPATIAELKAGVRVVLSVVEKAGKKTVTEVLMAEAPASGSPPSRD
jgi:Cu/Ag efflux protein CusF